MNPALLNSSWRIVLQGACAMAASCPEGWDQSGEAVEEESGNKKNPNPWM
jgi:hypothetical protein